MRQSNKIILHTLNSISAGEIKVDNYKLVAPSRKQMKNLMESLIQHFKFYSSGVSIAKSETYVAVEAPKGEFGVFLAVDNGESPYRCKLRAPGFMHLQAMNYMAKGHLIADVVTIIGTLDVVFGEIDR